MQQRANGLIVNAEEVALIKIGSTSGSHLGSPHTLLITLAALQSSLLCPCLEIETD